MVKRNEAVTPDSVLIACQNRSPSFPADLEPQLAAFAVELSTLKASTNIALWAFRVKTVELREPTWTANLQLARLQS